MLRTAVLTIALLLTAFGAGSPAIGAPVQHTVTTVNGLEVDQYRWSDSKGRPRTVSLKREGGGNPGHGGYAVQMTYQVKNGSTWKTIVANATPGGDGGFGYFVSHERYRDFTDGDYATIAHKVFGKDDSPLGLNFPVVGKALTLDNPNAAAHRFTLNYPRYGTVAPITKDANGEDVSRTPVAKSKLSLYQVPVTIIWVFQDGLDYPRIKISLSLENVPGPDRVNFDIRGPYGVLNFDNGGNSVISKVTWGDRFHFLNTKQPLTRNSTWQWSGKNQGARYTALIAGGFEMGLLEPRTFASSTLADGFSNARGKTSNAYQCDDQGEVLPCDYEWPYQSAQYSLPYDNNNGTTTFEKIAWGSTAFWGSGPSLPRVYDTSSTFKNFDGFPANKKISYNICVVLGKTVSGGLTRSVAAGPDYNCAAAGVP